MEKFSLRLTFVDVIRAFAICMMLQGHFIDGLLSQNYRDESNIIFSTWLYFRGITAPVFFTVSGFIFMYLLAKETLPQKMGWKHIRVQKGIKRGIVLIFTGYLLRFNIFNFFSDITDWNFKMVDVLHCIGLSLLFLIAIYLFSYKKKKWVAPAILLSTTFVLFIFSPIYNTLPYNYLPVWIANYFTKVNYSVFTIFPWFGYASFGAFMGVLFSIYKENKNIYNYFIGLSLSFGLLLIFGTSSLFSTLYEKTNLQLLGLLAQPNFVFQRLGNVLLIFAFFTILRNVITSKFIQKIGQNTLSIYIIHYIILYGSLTGQGLYMYLKYKLLPWSAFIGALLFIVVTISFSFLYNNQKDNIDKIKYEITEKVKEFLTNFSFILILFFSKIIHFFKEEKKRR